MEGLINSIKSTFAAPPADPSQPTETDTTASGTTPATGANTTTEPDSTSGTFRHTGDANTPDAPTLPGSFENDSSTPNAQPQEPRLPEMKTAGLGGALSSGHLTHLTRADADNASTTAVQDEPDSTSPEFKSAFTEQIAGDKGETGLEDKVADLGLGENKAGSTGLTGGDEGLTSKTGEDFQKQENAEGHHSLVQSKLNQDIARHTPSENEPELSSREGQVGAFDSEGTKAHDSTDEAPKALGVMGGSHLNSSDNLGPSSSEQEPTVNSLPGQVGAFDAEGTKVHDSTDSDPKPFGVMGGSHLNSSDNRGPDATEQEPTVSSLPGKVGAYDAEGTKVHDATDSTPKPFGIMGGSHLNSPDNRPETAGQPLRDDQGEGLLGPGPALMALPPTEPTSTTDLNADTSESKRSSTSSPAADESTSSNAATKSLSPETDEPLAPTTTARSLTPSGARNEEATSTGRSLTPSGNRADDDGTTAMGLDKKPSETSKVSDASSVNSTGSPKKVGLGEKVKGLVTEVKGKVKKDPVMVEEGKAMRHGEASPTSTV